MSTDNVTHSATITPSDEIDIPITRKQLAFKKDTRPQTSPTPPLPPPTFMCRACARYASDAPPPICEPCRLKGIRSVEDVHAAEDAGHATALLLARLIGAVKSFVLRAPGSSGLADVLDEVEHDLEVPR